MYDYSRVFFPKYLPYGREAITFTSKLERTQIPNILSQADWIRAYDAENQREIIEMFDSNGESMFDDPKFFDTYVNKMPIGMKRKSIFH